MSCAVGFAYHVANGQQMIVGGAFRTIEAPSRIVFSWLIEPPDEHARAGVAPSSCSRPACATGGRHAWPLTRSSREACR